MRSDWLNYPLAAPRYVWVVLAVAFVLMVVRGFSQSQSRQELLTPRALAATIAADQNAVVLRDAGSYLLLQRGSSTQRVELHQEFPQRTVLRWLEPESSQYDHDLVVPLSGLDPGRYVFASAARGAQAVPREMDQGPADLDVIARFELKN